MSRERELLEETLVVLETVHMDECDLYFAIKELLAQPKKELKREPLSVEEIADLWSDTNSVRNFARALEKAHGIGVADE